MCQVGAAGGGMPAVQQAPAKGGGMEGGGMPPAKVAGAAGAGMPPGKVDVPAKPAGEAGAGAALIGGGAGDIASILENLRTAIRSVMLAIGPPALPAPPQFFSPGPPGTEGRGPMFPAELGPSTGPQNILTATSGTGRPVTIVRQDFQSGTRFALNQPTGYDEAVKVDGKLFQFDASGRHLATVDLATQVRTPAA